MSLLVYNGVSVQLLRTLSFEMFNERDPSGTDATWNKYTIRCQGIVVPSGGLSAPSAATLAAVKHMLETPRRALSYQMNDGTTLVSTAGLDAHLGPEPLPAVVREVTSDAIFVECGYVVRLVDCPENTTQSPVVSLRWTQSESFDENWTSRLTTDGRLIVRSDLLTSADSFRALATPPVLTDYLRVSSSYTLSPSGTELMFAFVDEERDRLPPFPATKASGRFTVVIANGARRMGQVDIELTGQKGTSRKDLMLVAIRMGFSKLRAENVTFTSGGDFTEDLFEPRVSVRLQGALKSLVGSAGTSGIAAGGGAAPPMVFPTVGVAPLGAAPNRAGIAPPLRKRVTALLAAAFRDPCTASAADAELRTDPGGTSAALRNLIGPTGSGGSGYSLDVASLPPATAPAAVADDAPYEHYHVESTWAYRTGQAQLPGTGVGADGTKSAFVTVHGGFMRLEVIWGAARIGTPPVIPSVQSNDANIVLLGATITEHNIDIAADGATPVYAIGGFYEYGVSDPALATMAAAVPPFLADAIAPAAVQLAGYTSDQILWRFQGQPSVNPIFAPQVGTQPDDSLAAQLAGAAAIGGVAGAADSSTGDPPPPGGLNSGGNQGGLLGGPPVNG